MDDGVVTATATGVIATVMMDRPGQRNAISELLRKELIVTFSTLMADLDCIAIILTGAGGDLNDFALNSVQQGRLRMGRGRVLPRLIASGSKPLICAGSRGNGRWPVTCAGLRSHRGGARRAAGGAICQGWIDVGLWRIRSLHRRIGYTRATELLLQAKELSCERASEIAMANEVVDPRQALARAQAVAAAMTKLAPLSLEMIKHAQVRVSDIESIFTEEIDGQARLHMSADSAEAVDAFRERRPARFDKDSEF